MVLAGQKSQRPFMPKSLLEQLPDIVANGRKQAERILESLETRQRVRLQTREVVLPAKDSAAPAGTAASATRTAMCSRRF